MLLYGFFNQNRYYAVLRIIPFFQSIVLSFFLLFPLGLRAESCANVIPSIQLLGSGMTDQEEALALSEDQAVSDLIKKASAAYLSFLTQYQNGSLTWNQLQVNYTNIFTNLVTQTKAQIANSQTLIHAISNDYDSEHDTAFSQHIQLLLGLAEKNLGITAAQVFMPPLPSTDPTYPNLIQGGDLPYSKSLLPALEL